MRDQAHKTLTVKSDQENRWVTLIDFHGFTMRDALNTKISKAFSHMSGTYYPER